MRKIELKFTSPSKLETLDSSTKVNKVQWFYGEDNEYPLSLDIEQWQICSDVNGKVAHITDWLVKEETNAMILQEESNTSYKKIDFAFAVSMLGQLVNRNDLVQYLSGLKEAFENTDADTPKVPEQKDNNSSNDN
jgi:hypothetical protein